MTERRESDEHSEEKEGRRRDEEPDVEGHRRNRDDSEAEETDVEGHRRNRDDEGAEGDDDADDVEDVEAHKHN